jgi:hypothetical protein
MVTSSVSKIRQYSVLDSEASLGKIGVRFRRARSGPEEDLVRRLLERFSFRLPSSLQVTFFKEPQIESGAPDLVGVIWHRATAERWNEARLLLNTYDIRVMHYLTQSGTTPSNMLETLFGPRIKDALFKLEAAEMIRLKGGSVSPCSISTLYAARHIFAIEAKVTEWRSALKQAFLNRWFATSSHVLLPRVPSSHEFTSQLTSFGIGVWDYDRPVINLKTLPSSAKPVSYASWQFNEWAWRAAIATSQNHAES